MDSKNPTSKEMIYLICEWLNYTDIIQLRHVSKRMINVIDREENWKRILQTYFQYRFFVVNKEEHIRLKNITWKSKLFNIIKFNSTTQPINSKLIQEISL